MNVIPQQAAVVPRAIAPGDSVPLPLIDLIVRYADSNLQTIRIAGHGRSAALAHVAYELESQNFELGREVMFRDDASVIELVGFSKLVGSLCVFAATSNFKPDVELKLSDWSWDELIEYLIAKSPADCKSVMGRLMNANDSWLGNGSAILWPILLDLMIESADIQSTRAAIAEAVGRLNLNSEQQLEVRSVCCEHLFDNVAASYALRGMSNILDPTSIGFLSEQTVRYVVASAAVANHVNNGELHPLVGQRWHESFVDLVASQIEKTIESTRFLDRIANQTRSHHAAQAASLMVRVEPEWRPATATGLWLNQASLPNVCWSGVSLVSSKLVQADLSNSNLQKAILKRTLAASANLRHANLSKAKIGHLNAWRSDFSDATLDHVQASRAEFRYANLDSASFHSAMLKRSDLSYANLRRADFSNANLIAADLNGADVDETNFSLADMTKANLTKLDLRTSDLESACLSRANMSGCDLEQKKLTGIYFSFANLDEAILTATVFRNCSLRNCRLRGAKVADIDWEFCDLRSADFSGCHFHMGSTRSGKVPSDYPSHGTRTGFYTDEYDEKYFKRPEDIRKASLYGCDLRGAKVSNADFYLIDLREAQYDAKQKSHFQRCGAILTD